MDFNVNVGEKVLIELDEECYIGDVVLNNENRIDLENAEDFQTRKKFIARQRFYKKKIKSLKVIVSNPSEISTSSESTSSENPVERQVANISSNELDHINTVLDKIQYIYQSDEVYHRAVRNLRRRSAVALIVEGCEFGRNSKVTILTFATEDNIYIFDIVSLGQVYKDLREIIAADCPKKIIYNGRTLADLLKHKQNIEIQGVFDAFAVHVYVSKDKTAISLDKCVSHYINIPEQFFISDEDIDWFGRPFDNIRMLTTAKKAILLYKLYEHLVHKQLLAKVYEESGNFISLYSNNRNSSKVALKIATLSKDKEIEHVNISHKYEDLHLDNLEA